MAPETLQAVIDGIEAGLTLKQAIRDARTSWRALSLEIERNPDAASRYAHARTVSADFYADRAQEAVEQAVTPQDAAIARVRSDVYRWRAKVANPRVYSDRVDVTSDGKSIQQAVLIMPPEQIPDASFEVIEPQRLSIVSGDGGTDDVAINPS